MTEPTHIRKAIRDGALAELFAGAAAAHRSGASPTPPETITAILRTDPAELTFTGEHCWRHRYKPQRPVVHPYDECADCLDERAGANEWRELAGRPVQPPHVQAIYQPQLGDD
jgi:hypothetical protein